jgi:hypothetical protein
LALDPQALAAVNPAADADNLVRGAIEDYRKLREQATGIGQVCRFHRAVWKSVVGDGRVMGGLPDLYRAACAAVDDDFGLLVSRRCCGDLTLTTTPSEFPVIRTGEERDGTDEIEYPDGRHIPILVRGLTNLPWTSNDLFDELAGHSDWMSSFFDRRGSWSAGQTSDITWRNWMQATTRLRALTQCSTERVGKKWRGGSLRRVDVGRTIRARLRGERSDLWVQVEQPNQAAPQNELEDFEPICWAFEPSSLGSCTSYFTRGGQNKTYVTSHVYTTGLFPGRGPQGGWVQYLGGRLVLAPAATLRHSEASRALFRKWLRDSGRFVPGISIWDNDRYIREMLNASERQWYDRCGLHERLLLGAIYYARRYVIHARYESLRANAVFHRIARRRGVRIIEIDLSELGTELVENIRRFEFI